MNDTPRPHATVATIVVRDDRFLLVKEKRHGRIVYNQPAGHIETGESIIEAAVRETLEETRWRVRPTQVAGLCTYHAPNGVTYVRTTLIAEALEERPEQSLDPDIMAALWLSYAEIQALEAQLRSPVVKRVIDDYRRGIAYPLELISDQR